MEERRRRSEGASGGREGLDPGGFSGFWKGFGASAAAAFGPGCLLGRGWG
jgi:hypothetical protein